MVKIAADRVTWRELDGETILLDLANSRYLRLNTSGTVLLPGLVAGESAPELVARLRSRFDVDEAVAARDVDALIGNLDAAGLLEPA